MRIITDPNRGLSHARNAGLRAAQGEIVAYIDDDAWPDPTGSHYLAATFAHTAHAAVGGPNLPPAGDGEVGACVANAPGGPIHVLVERHRGRAHPGLQHGVPANALEAIGGFDEQFRRAGDDVDVCWRLLERGRTIGFSPAAVVWHHRRARSAAYCVSSAGTASRGAAGAEMAGEVHRPRSRVVDRAPLRRRRRGLARRRRIYHGTWGAAPFQSVYRQVAGGLGAFALTPEWYLLLLLLAGVSLLGVAWKPLALGLPLAGAGALLSVTRAARGAWAATFPGIRPSRHQRLRLLTAWLHLLQPLARLRGRLDHGLTPWRRRRPSSLSWPGGGTWTLWTERRREPNDWLVELEQTLRLGGYVVRRGGDFDGWDFEVSTGALGGVRVLMAHEEPAADASSYACARGRTRGSARRWRRASWRSRCWPAPRAPPLPR